MSSDLIHASRELTRGRKIRLDAHALHNIYTSRSDGIDKTGAAHKIGSLNVGKRKILSRHPSKRRRATESVVMVSNGESNVVTRQIEH